MLKLVKQVVSVLPRKDGNGWKLQKTHELLLIPHFTTRFGHPQNYDSGPGESALKRCAKRPARTSQKRRQDEFLRQVSCRVDDVEVIEQFHNITGGSSRRRAEIFRRVDQRRMALESRLAAELTNLEEEGNSTSDLSHSDDEDVATGLVYRLFRMDILPDGYRFSLNNGHSDNVPIIAKDALAKFVHRAFGGSPHIQSVTVQAFSEGLRTTTHKTTTFRSHFNYQSNGAWYDWALVNWEEDEVDDDQSDVISSTLLPAKILSIFQLSVQTSRWECLSEEQRCVATLPHVLLHCTSKIHRSNDPIGDSVLTRKYYLEYKCNGNALLRVAPFDALEELVLVTETTPGVHEHLHKLEERAVRLCLERERHWPGFF